MRILIHRNVFDDIELFKEVCEFILNDTAPMSITYINDFETIRFDINEEEQKEYDLDKYIELYEHQIEEQWKFTLEIEGGNYPN